jgi:hypothetical protein
METTIWICTGIICIVIMSLAYAVVRDITNSLGRIITLLDEIRKKYK